MITKYNFNNCFIKWKERKFRKNKDNPMNLK